MSKAIIASFSRRMPDNVTEELVAVLSSRASFEFKPLFDIVLLNLRERNAASGGGKMLRLRVFIKVEGRVGRGAAHRSNNRTTKKKKSVTPRIARIKKDIEPFV